MKENSIERLFGENVLEKMLQIQIDEFATDCETKALFNELCDMIRVCNLNNKELIELVLNLPYNMAYAVLAKNKNGRENIISEYREQLFQEFLRDAKDVSKKGVSKFERRFLTQSSNVDKILKDRILTRYELEVLFNKISNNSHLKDLSYKEKHEYKGDDMLLRQLSSAHEVLTNPKQSRARNKLFNKLKQTLLVETILKLKTLNINNV